MILFNFKRYLLVAKSGGSITIGISINTLISSSAWGNNTTN